MFLAVACNKQVIENMHMHARLEAVKRMAAS
jgi:hypothetical protein